MVRPGKVNGRLHQKDLYGLSIKLRGKSNFKGYHENKSEVKKTEARGIGAEWGGGKKR